MNQDTEKTAIGVVENPDRTQVVSEAQTYATQYAASVECPVCKTANPPSERYCTDCGFLLDSEPVATAEAAEVSEAAKLTTPDGTREFVLSFGENVVGRENADVLLSHNTVSRNHAKVIVEDGGMFVEDVGSTNGTFVDGERIEADTRVELTDGAEVVFGSLGLQVVLPSVGEEQPAEADTQEQPEEESEPEAEAVADSEEEPEAEVAGDEAEPSEEVVGRLVAKDGSTSLDLAPGEYKIGRREGENDIVVADSYCSGRHAELIVEHDKLTVTDLGSTNGTQVNGVALQPNSPQEIKSGDVLLIGRTEFELEVA